ncbi:MAG: CBS domain-containing protein [Lysobacteraceae bacterium]|nr:MAG: CBS domain-containing protein [Xanthomonadaceae bacterium]
MQTLGQLVEAKGGEIWSVTPETPVLDAISMMAEKGIGALLVINAGGELVGMLSERDYARKVILKGRSSRSTPAEAIMSHPVVCARSAQTVDQAMGLMTEKRFRHLPVVNEAEQLIGMVSIGDLVKSIIAEQQHQIEQLEHYIAG